MVWKTVFICLAFLCSALAPSYGAGAHDKIAAQAGDSVHASPWAFGRSSTRDDEIWKKGVDSRKIFRNNPQGNVSISEGKAAAREEARKRHKPLGLSMKDESGTWKVAPDSGALRPDELKLRDNRHVVSAFADVEAGEDLSIRLGPELILRDDTKGDETARADQPETVFGLGMNFKYDF